MLNSPILVSTLGAVVLLFAWSEWRLQKMPSTREEFDRYRTVIYLLVAGIFMICGASVVFALKSGLLSIAATTYLAGGMLIVGCFFLVVVFVRVFLEGLNLFKAEEGRGGKA